MTSRHIAAQCPLQSRQWLWSTHHTCAACGGHACAALWSHICVVHEGSISAGHEGHTSIGVWLGNACKEPDPHSGELFANTNVSSWCEQLV